MGFVADLNEGKEFETFVREKILSLYGLELEEGPHKGVDLVSPLLNVEVKFDRRFRETGNLFLEYEYD